MGEALNKSATDSGAEYFFNTHAEQLVGNAEGGITGVIATGEDGKYVQFNASKGVILATGDISGNQEMVDAWAPICNRSDAFIYTPQGANTGDGILMGSWAGAAISKSPAAPMVYQFTPSSYTFNLTAFIMSWPCSQQERRALRRRDPVRAVPDERPHEHAGRYGVVRLRCRLSEVRAAAVAHEVRDVA